MKQITDYYHNWNNDIAFLNNILEREFGEDMFAIDEVALMFNSKADAWAWLEEALPNEGVTLFNFAKDQVRTYPFHTDYHVNYMFVTTPYEYRLELMVMGGGLSPLHEAVRHNGKNDPSGLKPTVHYSFKCRDTGEYDRVVDWFSKAEYGHVQSCVSMYGRFGYWHLSENVDPMGALEVYLKPRVNTRDSKQNISEAADYLSSKAGK